MQAPSDVIPPTVSPRINDHVNPLSLDDWLDRTVALGYGSLGYRLRGQRPQTAIAGRLDGRVALVTGASAGIGEAVCLGLLRAGASVRMLVRDRIRGERARERILARLGDGSRPGGAGLELDLCDLSDLGAVRALAAHLLAAAPRLHVLVNNAGVLAPSRQRSPDGLELTFATNVAAPFLLTRLLMPALRADGDARVVTVSSGGMYAARLDADDLQSQRDPFDGSRAYARSKRAEVILTELAAERCAAAGVRFYAMHPGWVDTPGIREAYPRFHAIAGRALRDADAGADTIVWLATRPGAPRPDGTFWHDRRRRPTHRVPWTRESPRERERLWDQCVALTDAVASRPGVRA